MVARVNLSVKTFLKPELIRTDVLPDIRKALENLLGIRPSSSIRQVRFVSKMIW